MSPIVRRLFASPGVLALSAVIALSAPLAAQQGRVFTAADYARAERAASSGRGGGGVTPGGTVTPNWTATDQMWYRNAVGDGGDFVLVDPAHGRRSAAFNQAKVAAALGKVTGASYDAMHLPFTEFVYGANQKSIEFNVGGKGYSCDTGGAACRVLPAEVTMPAPAAGGFGGRGRGGGGRGGFGGGARSSDNMPVNMAPDGKQGVFIRNYNLWRYDPATRQETQLTTDGVTDFGYATSNAGWTTSDAAFGVWSPDGTMFATNQQDERNVGKMYLVRTPLQGGHPTLSAWNYPLPGDSIITTIQRVIVNATTGKVVRFQMPADQHRGSSADNLQPSDLIWSPDGKQLAFISTSRDHKVETVRVADAATGAVRTVFTETSPTQYESYVNWRILWDTGEIIWYSQRDNHGHLYLYDLATGKLKNLITNGPGNVSNILDLDEKGRTLTYVALGGEAGQNPYFRHYYRVNLDGTHQVSLTPDNGDHDAPRFSPSKKYFVDTWSETDVPPTSVLRSGIDGHQIMPLEKGDRARLLAAGWHPVTPIRMKDRNGKWDIYGLMYTPTNLDSTRKYPIINHIYPGPQTGSTSGGWGFRAGGGEPQGLAELGFIVVEIDGTGTPGRDKDFMDAYYGRMGDNTLPDQVAGMQQLARQYPFIDIDKAGIYGHSGGGFATADAMFRYPDFFKVGISESGNHDNREYEDDWGERYEGLLTRNADGTDNYTTEANQNYAQNLKGHLLLAHGTMDNNVPPYNTLAVVDALIKANKDFDLLLIPNVPHGYGAASQYMQRRRWDYFVTWLMGATPPKEYQMGSGAGGAGGRGAGGRGGRGGGAPPAAGGGGR